MEVFTKPSTIHENDVMEYKENFMANKEQLYGSSGLDEHDSFADWLNAVRLFEDQKTVPKGYVKSEEYLFYVDEKLIGMINLRHELNDMLEKTGGHIGYSVIKCERNKGYATKMLNFALQKYREIKIQNVFITCDLNNIASAKVIEKNGGILENIINDEDNLIKRYWINL